MLRIKDFQQLDKDYLQQIYIFLRYFCKDVATIYQQLFAKLIIN